MNTKHIPPFGNIDCREFAKFLTSLSPLTFSILGSILGAVISIPLSPDQQNSIGNFLELVGQVILTYNAQEILVNQNSTSSNDLNALKTAVEKDFEELQRQINLLKSRI